MSILGVIPILSSADIKRDVKWYADQLGFDCLFSDDKYALVQREGFEIHLQWHAGDESDPLITGAVVRVMVDDINTYNKDLVIRGTVEASKIQRDTAWNTHEVGVFDLNMNAIIFVQRLL